MNILSRIYCRSYQFAFKIALPFLPYRRPSILSSNEDIVGELNKLGLKKVLIVTDKGIRGCGIVMPLEECLKANDIPYVIYDDTACNPTTENIINAKKLYIDNKCEAIIAIGGGSSIDCAKAVGAAAARPKKTMKQMKGLLKIYWKTPTMFAIPTTAGTGSETTLAAVITDSVTRHKYPMNSFPLIPDYAVLDPKVTVSLPKHLTATTGMDALTHAVEAYIGGTTTKETRHDSLEAVKLIYENIDIVCSEPDNLEARANMLRASYCAGNAFTKSYVGYVHSVAHSLGGMYNTPHGLANAVILPHVLESYGSCIYGKLKKLGVAAGVCTDEDSPEAGADKFIQSVKDMKVRLGIEDCIHGIIKEDIPKLAKYAAKEGNPLYPVPKLMNARELEKFYYDVMEA